MGNKNSEKILTVESNSYLIFNEKYDSGAAQGSPCLPHISPPQKKKLLDFYLKRIKNYGLRNTCRKLNKCMNVCVFVRSLLVF